MLSVSLLLPVSILAQQLERNAGVFLEPYQPNTCDPGINSDATGRPFSWQQLPRDGPADPLATVRPDAYAALALLAEDSVRSYPSWIAELRRKSTAGVDRRHYAYEHLGPGEPLELIRGPTNPSNDHAVAYYHRGVHLGYVPRRHRWIAEALDDGLHLMVLVENVKPGWIFRRRAKFIGTRIIVFSDGR